jgi:hypothetical protein
MIVPVIIQKITFYGSFIGIIILPPYMRNPEPSVARDDAICNTVHSPKSYANDLYA